MINWMRALLASTLLTLAFTATAHAQDTGVKVLVFHGPQDATTTAGVAALKALGSANSFTVESTGASADMTAEKLEGYRALVFLNTAGDLLNAEQEGAVQGFVEAGNGFLGIGSAAQGEAGAFFDGLIGARPAASSSVAESPQRVVPGDRVHPSTRALPLLWDRTDVWYSWTARVTGSVHVVARYRAPTAAAGDATKATGDTDTPIAWCRDYRGGRSFYTGMGRTAAAYGEADVSKHLLGAVQWASGLSRGNCKATIDANYKGTKIMSAGEVSTGLVTSGESHGIATAANGWMLYIGRGDCRTDAERGSLLGNSPLGRSFDHADPNVGIGCGSVHVYDPALSTGTENSGVTLAGKLAVYGDGGQGGERTDQAGHKMEYGLTGIAPSPDFASTGHVYLQYFPSFNPNSKPPGLSVDRRISKISRPRISRFTIDLATKKLDLASELRVFEYDAQIYSCCHIGGGMGFDSDGALYVTTGDTNSSQGTDGYSGNNPAAKCPTGDNTIPTSANCGSAGYSYQDARRTAGNTNDYNGKLLRIKPIKVPSGQQPVVGVGTTYVLPTEQSPNGPNLFDGLEGGGNKAKPEIFAMGLRNPSRLSIDPETDAVHTAWVGPDAGVPSATAGPSTYENAAQITRAGNYGWPYCMGNKQPYRDRLADGALRTDSPAGYVGGGPATGGTEGWYDCDNLRNDSPNNTGLIELPHVTGTKMDAGKVRGSNLWYSRGNPGNNNGCPEFPRPRGAGSAPDYGATPTQLCPYAQNSGMTIMDGPVYRHTPNAADNSKRWPDYWDGRWFLHNNGGPSVKHGLLLDPTTAGDGGLPVYADSLRDTLTWSSGSYMDSKFGTDGALYVQTYDGFFRAAPGVSIYRYDYTGGAATPGATPKGVPIGAKKVKFSSAGSGGVSYKWEFGDGTPDSNVADPEHLYAEAKRYTAKLTVTYNGGGTDAKTVDVDVLALADEIAPVTTAAFTPAQPGAGGTYERPVTVALTATDGTGSGVERTEYRINGGEYLTYSAPVTRSQPGAYAFEYRSADRTGNVETAKTAAFTIAAPSNCTTNINDEFDGTTLDPKWTVLRGDAAQRSFAGGRLRMNVRTGDMIGGTATAQNVLLQKAPEGSWQATTKLDVSTLTTGGDQAGFVLWNAENPNTFAKITYISKGTFSQWEWVATRNGVSQISAGSQFSAPGDVYLRVSSNGGGTYTAEGSVDGERWQQISQPITNLGDPATLKVGLKVSNGQSSTTRYAGFDSFRVDCSDKVPPTTTARFDKERPDGELGWYTKTPTIALTADDGVGGGVAGIRYSVDGAEAKPYDKPFTVEGDGEHVVTYFATDKAENVETVKRTAFRVDSEAPVTTGSATIADAANGPATVKLDVEEKGSGSVLTEYRVDGGPWVPYASKDEQIFDGSAASLAQWKQAPSGRFDLMSGDSGGITPIGGLGMLWYPKPYGDFRVKLQFREGRTDAGSSNGGVFVRFPNPDGPRKDECSKRGSAATQPAWVAIFCGHEIQLYDGQDGESRKTGSIYTFDNNTIDKIGPKKARGEWEDYEIEVVGQDYTISRNGTVIKEFENAPGKASDRAGDPSTTLRQFTEGYIGLQNHGGPDTMQYRDIHVEDLSEDAIGVVEAKPFTVTGKGPHTVEARSTDAAGNKEAKRTLAFEIGAPTPPGSTVGRGSTVVPLVPAAPGTPPPPMQTGARARLGTTAKASFGSVSAKITRATFAKRGIVVPIACTGAMSGSAKLTVASSVARTLKLSRATLAAREVRCYGRHAIRVSLKPSSALSRQLARKGGPKSVKMTLSAVMRDFGKSRQTTKKTITLRR